LFNLKLAIGRTTSLSSHLLDA